MITPLLAALAVAAQPTGLPPPRPAQLQGAVQYDLASQPLGRTYRVYVSAPEGAAPKGGWPVIYVMDGDLAFPAALTQMPDKPNPYHRQAVLVGIGYADATRKAVQGLRVRDLTPSQPDAETRTIAGAKPGEGEFGKADAMLRFIDEEVQPKLAAAYPLDVSDRTLIGYSLGGLFALHTLFAHPTAFRTVVAGSPSIWWNHGEVLGGEAGFARAVESGKAAPRVLITSGSLEETPAGVGVPDTPMTRTFVAKAAMIGNARSVADRLKALHGGADYTVRYVLFDGEGHNTGTVAAMSRAVNFALEK